MVIKPELSERKEEELALYEHSNEAQNTPTGNYIRLNWRKDIVRGAVKEEKVFFHANIQGFMEASKEDLALLRDQINNILGVRIT